MEEVKITFYDKRSSNQGEPVVFSEKLDGGGLKSLQQTVLSMQTKMNDWLTAEIEKAKSNPTQCGDGVKSSQVDDNGDDDDEEDDDEESGDDSEPPAKQKKT